MGEAAADGAAVPHLHVADVGRGFRQQRAFFPQQRRAGDLLMRRHGADGEMTTFVADDVQRLNAPDVDHHFGPGEAQLHGRNQAVPARQQLRRVAVLHQHRDRFIDTRRPQVFERSCIHTIASDLSLER